MGILLMPLMAVAFILMQIVSLMWAIIMLPFTICMFLIMGIVGMFQSDKSI